MEYTKLVNNIYSSLPPSTSRSKKSSIADTGEICHYLQDDSQNGIALWSASPIKVKQTNGQILKFTKGCQLELATLPDEASKAHILTGIAHSSLISIGKLCDTVFEDNFNQQTMSVTKYDKIVLQGTRYVMIGLYIVPLQVLNRPTHQRNNIHQVNDKDNFIKYLHAAAFISVQDTWSKAVN